MITHSKTNPILEQELKQEEQEEQEDIIIICGLAEMKKHFVKESLILWYDSKVSSAENTAYVQQMKNVCNDNIEIINDLDKAISFLHINTIPCQVITSGTNGEKLVEEIINLESVTFIHVFCGNPDYHKTWSQKYQKIKSVSNQFKTILNKIILLEKQISSQISFPAYAPIFDDYHKSENICLHLYLKGFTIFSNREQAKRDFVALSREIYGNTNKEIKNFENNYKDYNMAQILRWYTKECFLYKIINNCLRLATSDSILYCRLILKDLEQAIIEKYQQKSKEFSGVVYRGTYLSSQEWTQMQQNTGKDIEMFGFLSTTKQKDVALEFLDTDTDRNKKALIIILIPGLPDVSGQQGFAEIKEYSAYKEEDEVLFNVRSRFRILETTEEIIHGKQIRQLVLLYGAQIIEEYVKKRRPIIKINMDLNEKRHCEKCRLPVVIPNEFITVFLNLSKAQELICMECVTDYQKSNKSPLLCCSNLSQNQLQDIQINGIVLKYAEDLKIPFYGYNACKACKKSDYEYCFKCLTCKDERMIYCKKCFSKENVCLKGKHFIVIESYPFSFWSQRLLDNDFSSVKFQESDNIGENHKFAHGEILSRTHNHNKAIEYYEKVSKKVHEEEDIAYILDSLGVVYSQIGRYQTAITFHEKALKINEKFLEEKRLNTASSYHNLGVVYSKLGDYQTAIEYNKKALKIREKILGERHQDTATSYNKLGLTYSKVGEHYRAIEFNKKALEIRKSILGEIHQYTATSYYNLGVVSYNLDKKQSAAEFYEKALRIRKLVLGEKHLDTAAVYNKLGDVHSKLEKYDKAIEFYEKGLEIRKIILGENHLDTATSCNNLGVVYSGLKKYQRAIDFYQRALEIKKIVLEEKHQYTANSYFNLGVVYYDLKEHQKAREFYQKALEIRKATLGEKHQDTATSYHNLGVVYHDLRQYQKAREFYEKALEIRKLILGENHQDTATSYHNLEVVCQNLREPQKVKFIRLNDNIFSHFF